MKNGQRTDEGVTLQYREGGRPPLRMWEDTECGSPFGVGMCGGDPEVGGHMVG